MEVKYLIVDNDHEELLDQEGLKFSIVLETDQVDIIEVHGEENLINEFVEKNKKFIKLTTKKNANLIGQELLMGESVWYEDKYGNEKSELIVDFDVDEGITTYDEIKNSKKIKMN